MNSAAEVLAGLTAAMNRRDLAAFVGYFDEDYQSEQPSHPDRRFRGRAQVERNWAAMLAGYLTSRQKSCAAPLRTTRCGLSGDGLGRAPTARGCTHVARVFSACAPAASPGDVSTWRMWMWDKALTPQSPRWPKATPRRSRQRQGKTLPCRAGPWAAWRSRVGVETLRDRNVSEVGSERLSGCRTTKRQSGHHVEAIVDAGIEPRETRLFGDLLEPPSLAWKRDRQHFR